MARLLRCLMSRVRSVSGAELSCLFRLHACLGSKGDTLPTEGRPTALDLEDELISLVSDTERRDSLASVLAELQRVGGQLRERLSADMSRLVGHLGAAGQVDGERRFVDCAAVLDGCLELLSAFSGMERENVTRGPGWVFMSLGRRLERAMYSARQLGELTAPFDENSWPLLDYLLEVADSSMTYRSRYFTTLQPVAVLDVLMSDETNPRSLTFQLRHLRDLYQKLPRHVPADLAAMERAVALLDNLDLTTVEYALPGANPDDASPHGRAQLDRALADLADLLASWGDNVSSNYFGHIRTFPISIGG
jgi:uncharacterized alpha-E superfamily protein